MNSGQYIYKKHFKHFRDERILSAILKICWCLGRHGNVVLLVDHLLDVFRSSSANRKQVVFLINEIVRGSVVDADQTYSNFGGIFRQVIEYLFFSDVFFGEQCQIGCRSLIATEIIPISRFQTQALCTFEDHSDCRDDHFGPHTWLCHVQ